MTSQRAELQANLDALAARARHVLGQWAFSRDLRQTLRREGIEYE